MDGYAELVGGHPDDLWFAVLEWAAASAEDVRNLRAVCRLFDRILAKRQLCGRKSEFRAAFVTACERGHLEFAIVLHRRHPGWSCASRCRRHGKWDPTKVKFIFDTAQRKNCLAFAFHAAIGNRRYSVVEWLLEHRSEFPTHALEQSVELGDVRLLAALYRRFARPPSGESLMVAASRGHLDVLRWWCDTCFEPSGYELPLVKHAIEQGHFRLVEFLHERGFQISNQPHLRFSGLRVSLEVDSRGFHPPWVRRIFRKLGLCREEHVQTLCTPFQKWVSTERPELFRTPEGKFDTRHLLRALFGDNFELARWYFSFCERPLDLAWAVNLDSQPQNILGSVLLSRSISKDDAIWLLGIEEFEPHYRKEAPMEGAIRRGDLGLIEWLENNGTHPWPEFAGDLAASLGHIDIVRHLHEHRSESFTAYAMNRAAGSGHLDVVVWLHENRTEGCSEKAMNWAASSGHWDVVRWLHENRTEGCTADAFMQYSKFFGTLDDLRWFCENCAGSEECVMAATKQASSNKNAERLLWLCDRFHVPLEPVMQAACQFSHYSIVRILHGRGVPVPLEYALSGDWPDRSFVKWFYHTVKFDSDAILAHASPVHSWELRSIVRKHEKRELPLPEQREALDV